MGFGSRATANTENPLIQLWLTPPDYETSKAAFTRVGVLKAEIEVLEDRVKETERQIKRGSKKADDIDAAKEATVEDREKLTQLKSELHKAEYEIKWLDYHKEIAKLIGFTLR